MQNRNIKEKNFLIGFWPQFTMKAIFISLTLLNIPYSGHAQNSDNKNDLETLKNLNAQFISNFINEDTAAHNQIIYKDFVCIASSGAIINRKDYMKEWARSYNEAQFKSFDYTDEIIRIFGNFALVRSKTVWTKEKEGEIIKGTSVYTDTYLKENGRWWCIQAQITKVADPSSLK